MDALKSPASPASSRRNLLRFLGYAGKYKILLGLAIVTGIVRYLIPLVLPWTLKILVDDFLTPPLQKPAWELHLLMAGLAGVYVFYGIVSYFRSYFAGLAGNQIIFELRQALYLHIQRMSLSFFDRRRIGEVVNRMTGDIASAHHLVGSAIVNTTMDLVFVAAVLIFLFATHAKLALISLSVLPFYAWATYYLTKRIRAKSDAIHQKHEEISGELHEQFSAISTIQAFTREEIEAEEFRNQTQTHLENILSNVRLQSVALGVTGFLTALGPILVLWLGAMEVWAGQLSVGTLMAFYAYLGMLYQPIQRLTELNLVLANSFAAIQRIFEMLDTYPEVREYPQPIAFGPSQGEISFENVSFSYGLNRRVYADFSVRIPAGQSVALIGPSGAGKSTLAKLLLRFYDVNGGRITLDGMDIRFLSLKSLRQQIAFVSQDPILLSGTVLENLRYGKANATKEEIERASRAAFADRFIEKLPEGYDTEIGERGVRLSGGEKQRLAIARAFLKDAPILIMDEPTSALDPETEAMMKEAIDELLRRRTSIIIAHRLSTIEKTDRVLVMEDGSLLEQGRHEELLKHPESLYRKYLARQVSLLSFA